MDAISPRTGRASRTKRRILAALLAGGAGAAAGFLWTGDLSSLGIVALVPPIGLFLSKGSSAIFFLSYFLSAIRSVPAFYPIFYSGATALSGVPVWLAWGACLVPPWILARHLTVVRPSVSVPGRLLIGYLPAFFPPLWFVGAASPLFSAGILFPGLGLPGLVLLVVFQSVLSALLNSRWERRSMRLVFVGLTVVSLIANALERPPTSPSGWVALGTADEPRPLLQRPPWEFAVAKRVLSALDSGARVVLLPEGIATFWTKDPAGQISLPYPWSGIDREARARHATVLIGSEVPENSRMRVWDDALVALGEGGIRAFPARQPIPVAGWNPFSKTHHEPSHWRKTGVATIAGSRALVSLCFEDLLIGSQVEADLLGHPRVVLSADNLWFSKGTSDRGFQSVSIRSIGRLFGIPVLRAVNQ